MSRAVLSLGSNMGDRLGHLQAAVDELGGLVEAVSAVYRTPPWGPVAQPDFYNTVVVATAANFEPIDWLKLCQRLEHSANRVRTQRWGPRTLDVDVVTCDDVISDDPELTLPHPRAAHRAFVLVPWLEVDPEATLAIDGKPVAVADLIDRLDANDVAHIQRIAERLVSPC